MRPSYDCDEVEDMNCYEFVFLVLLIVLSFGFLMLGSPVGVFGTFIIGGMMALSALGMVWSAVRMVGICMRSDAGGSDVGVVRNADNEDTTDYSENVLW